MNRRAFILTGAGTALAFCTKRGSGILPYSQATKDTLPMAALQYNIDHPILFAFGGESNPGGLAANTFLTPTEAAVRNLKILNNSTLASFDNLEIGTNNLLEHVGLNYAQNDAHGWENQLANRVDARAFGGRKIFLAKIAQGGTTSAQWADEATYSAESQTIEPFDTAVTRIQAAIALIEAETGRTPKLIMIWSQGINDIGIGTDPEVFKDNTIGIFNSLRSALGVEFPIWITQFQSINTTYDSKIAEIPDELNKVFLINTTGCETTQVFAGAGSHFGYTGMKQSANTWINSVASKLNSHVI